MLNFIYWELAAIRVISQSFLSPLQCSNRSRFVLDVNKSRFVDFQKVRIQEVQAELPRGCIPRSVEIILRADAVESAQPGDKCVDMFFVS